MDMGILVIGDITTVEPHFVDTSIIWTPLSLIILDVFEKNHIFPFVPCLKNYNMDTSLRGHLALSCGVGLWQQDYGQAQILATIQWIMGREG